MPNKKPPKLPNFNIMIKLFWEDFAPSVAEEAQSFFKESFDKEGFISHGLKEMTSRHTSSYTKVMH